MRHIKSMHLKVGYFVLYTPIYRLTERKKRFHIQNCTWKQVMCSRYQCTTMQLSNLVGQYSSSIVYYKTPIKYGENTHNRRVFMHTNTPSVTIQGNITAMRFRNDAIRWILLLHIRANLGMMLTLDNAARSTLVKLVANTCKYPDGLQSLDLNPIDQISGSSSVLFLRSVRPFHKSIFIDTCYQ